MPKKRPTALEKRIALAARSILEIGGTVRYRDLLYQQAAVPDPIGETSRVFTKALKEWEDREAGVGALPLAQIKPPKPAKKQAQIKPPKPAKKQAQKLRPVKEAITVRDVWRSHVVTEFMLIEVDPEILEIAQQRRIDRDKNLVECGLASLTDLEAGIFKRGRGRRTRAVAQSLIEECNRKLAASELPYVVPEVAKAKYQGPPRRKNGRLVSERLWALAGYDTRKEASHDHLFES